MSMQYEVVTEDGELILPPQSKSAYNAWFDQEGSDYEFLIEVRHGFLVTVTVR